MISDGGGRKHRLKNVCETRPIESGLKFWRKHASGSEVEGLARERSGQRSDNIISIYTYIVANKTGVCCVQLWWFPLMLRERH